MYIEKRKLSQPEQKRIGIIANTIVIAAFVFLLFSFWNIQILKNQYYTDQATSNIRKELEIKAPRGLVLDRNLHRISENKISFNLFLIREYAHNLNRTTAAAARLTGMDEIEIKRNIDKYKGYPKSYAIPVKKDLSLAKVIYIESRSDEFPEFEINTEPARAYPYKKMASHILGYLSELTPGQLEKKAEEGYKLGDVIGKSGIEKIYERDLRGVSGVRTVVKDNLGKVREILGEEKPTIGGSVVLTIDMELQEYIEGIFEEHKGTVGVVDLADGGMLAMVSKPNFNPEFFTGPLERDQWLALVNDPDKPLHNKFLQGLYLPGSVFKVVMALAGLQEKEIDTSTLSTCYGRLKIYDRFFHCWKRSGHGSRDIYNALKDSCNIYFYRLGKKMDIDVIARYATLLGLGRETAIDLKKKKKGLFPTKDWKLRQL
ncbi:MAG: penicillin-binding protein 2, partial [bacterium]|nr:penicillin-binding protein 2 [bacterium]